MLGEKHSLLLEFPDSTQVIQQLAKQDNNFAYDANKYDRLDDEIRKIELGHHFVDDDTMNQKKRQRALLKDILYQRILQAEQG